LTTFSTRTLHHVVSNVPLVTELWNLGSVHMDELSAGIGLCKHDSAQVHGIELLLIKLTSPVFTVNSSDLGCAEFGASGTVAMI